jgi:hypothetical protein
MDMVGIQFTGELPFYNIETGDNVRNIGYSLDTSLIVNVSLNNHFSIMALTCFSNGLTDPITSAYERKWTFDRVRLIATWHIK